MFIRALMLLIIMVAMAPSAHAKEIYLGNGDRISGTIIEETDEAMIVETEAMGIITVNKSYLKKEAAKSKNAGNSPQWHRKASLGYSQTGGNTKDSQGSIELKINRKTKGDEWSGALKAFISTSNEELDAKKFYGMGRYAFSYGSEMKWYNFYKFESEQDRFANIDYRLVPSAGIGYWILDKDDFKLMAEGAIGFEHTNYRDNTESDNEAILIPRGFFEKTLFGSLKLSEDITLYPSLTDSGEYRLHSETDLINPISDQVSWKISFIDDYNSSPSGGTKKNDFRLITSLDYSF